jgi:multicomponent Na+:H+ antiporter subunit E
MNRIAALAHPARSLWLLALWLALWGTITPANVLSGLLVAALVQVLPDPHHVEGRVVVRPLAALHLVAWFAYKVVEASLVVAREVVTRQDRIHTGVVEVPLVGASDGMVTFVANAIGMIPGSLTIEVRRDPPTLFVHALHVDSVEAVRGEVHRLEVLAIRAFGSAEALAGLATDDSSVAPRSGPGEGP